MPATLATGRSGASRTRLVLPRLGSALSVALPRFGSTLSVASGQTFRHRAGWIRKTAGNSGIATSHNVDSAGFGAMNSVAIRTSVRTIPAYCAV